MYLYKSVYIRICMYIYIYICVYVYVYIYMHIYICIWYVYMIIYVCIYMYMIWIYVCMYIYIYVLYMYNSTYIYIYTRTYVYIYTYIYTHICARYQKHFLRLGLATPILEKPDHIVDCIHVYIYIWCYEDITLCFIHICLYIYNIPLYISKWLLQCTTMRHDIP